MSLTLCLDSDRLRNVSGLVMQAVDALPISTRWPTDVDIAIHIQVKSATSTAPVALLEVEHRRAWLEHVLQPDINPKDVLPPARLVTLLQQVLKHMSVHNSSC
jgi:hypothetical protein